MPRACFYELLGVEIRADQETIKKAFRKQALIWHPDKNPDNPETAKRKFQSLQEAYETLSNPQERAWYDGHRDEILGGLSSGSQSGCVNLWGFFSREAFADFDDGPKGFFTVYAELFATINAEEIAWSDLGESVRPPFGDSKSSWREAGLFYRTWGDFVSNVKCEHAAKWKLSDAPNREVRRLMEAENKKLSNKARREYTEQVRHLVGWVKNRDPRYVQRQKELAREAVENAEAERIKKERQEIEARRARIIQRKNELIRAEEYRQYREECKANGQMFPSSSDTEDNDVTFGCAPCRKTFKSSKQLISHQQSKKHVQICKQLGINPAPPSMKEESPAPALKSEDIIERKVVDVELLIDGRDSDTVLEESALPVSLPSDTTKPPAGIFPVGERAQERASTKPPSERASSKPPSESSEDSPSLDEVLPTEHAPRPVQKKKRRAEKSATASTGVSCLVCNAQFESRTKLFKHVEQEGHAAPLSEVKRVVGKKASAATKKKNK